MRQPFITYCLLFLIAFSSCNLELTKCEEIKNWKIGDYKIVKSKCLGPAGPHYYPLSLYKDNKFLGENGFQKDTCTTTFQADNDLYLIFDICQNTVVEIKPQKKQIDLTSVDSVQIYSNTLNQTKLLAKSQLQKFIKDWNNSKVSDYRSGHIDSVFYPTFQYKLIVYSGTNTKEFLGGNYLISDRTNWTYYINGKEDINYFNKLWDK